MAKNPKKTPAERYDSMTANVKGMVDRQKIAQEAKTTKLRNQRLARDADKSAAPVKNGKR